MFERIVNMRGWKLKIKQTNISRENGKSHIPFRLNLLFGIVFLLFVALIVQLGQLQIANSNVYESKLKETSAQRITKNSPRGMIYDATGKPLVENEAQPAITYTRAVNVTASQMLETAEKLSMMITITPDRNLSNRDLKDYWLANSKNLEKAQERLTKKEKTLVGSESYEALLSHVTKKEIKLNKQQKIVATIFKRMNQAQELTTIFLKNEDVTQEELAIVGEHASELPGVSTGTDWKRKVISDSLSLTSIIGRVSNGLTAENADEYLAKGYSLDDRIGTSFIEKQYEEYLQGTKEIQEISFSRQGSLLEQVTVSPGQKGDNVKLTINDEFQKKVDQILKNKFQDLVDKGYAQYSPGAYAVVMNPKTGAILAMSGFYHEISSNEIQADTIGVYKKAFTPGSVMKAGTLTAGWENDVISGNQVLYEQPILLKDSAPKASIFNKLGYANRNLTAVQALEVSSNSYMIQIALRLLGINYSGKTISVPSVSQQADAFEKLRSALAEYGLGVKTGIDLPDEETGLQPTVDSMSDANYDGGKLLDLSFGQFDTYTPLQLAQYVSTIANNGIRVQPHIVSGIYKNTETGGLGELKEEVNTKELNQVDLSKKEIEVIQKGFYEVVNGTDPYTTGRSLQDSKIDLAAKTGTAEGVVYDKGQQISVDNLNAVAYGPVKDPEIAVAVVIPQLKGENLDHPNLEVVKDITNVYYDLFIKK